MKPVRISILAAATAAMLALPVTSADAHRRHHRLGGNAAGALALGIISGAILNQALTPRYHYRAPPGYCYDPYGRTYYCNYSPYADPYYRPLPRVEYYGPREQYYRHHDRIYGGHKYYEILRNERH